MVEYYYFKTSSTLALIFAFPPEGKAIIPSHSEHLTFVAAFPNIICEFLHLEHFTLTNFESALTMKLFGLVGLKGF